MSFTSTCRIYVYPNPQKVSDATQNPYIDNLMDNLSNIGTVINKAEPTSLGIFDIYRKLLKIDVVIFNWIEYLPDNRFGKVQSLLVFPLLCLMKILGKKIIWIFHDKKTQNISNKNWKDMNYRLIMKFSDFILTHSKEGIELLRKAKEKVTSKAIFLHHPVNQSHVTISDNEKTYDILIWGSARPYKGIDKFLEVLKQKGMQNTFKIMIAGKFSSEEYYNKVIKLAGEQVTVRNEFIEKESLTNLITHSKIILFTYSTYSVLSSAALMDSILFSSKIIGPLTGAFADLNSEELIDCYSSLEELPELIKSVLNKDDTNLTQAKKREQFLKANTWEQFTENFYELSKIHIPKFNYHEKISNNIVSTK